MLLINILANFKNCLFNPSNKTISSVSQKAYKTSSYLHIYLHVQELVLWN